MGMDSCVVFFFLKVFLDLTVIFIASAFIMSKHILNHRCECMCVWVASGMGKPSASCQGSLLSWKNTVRGLFSMAAVEELLP